MNLRSHRAPPRRRDEARDLFRNGILEAAEAVFAERGFHAARIQDIARRARIGVGTVYNHFEHKQEVLAALVNERLDALLASFAPAAGDPAGFRARLERRVARLVELAEAHRGFIALVLDSGRPRLDAAWRRVVNEGVAARALRVMDRGVLAAYFGAVVRAVLVNKKLAAADRAALIVRLFLDGAGRVS